MEIFGYVESVDHTANKLKQFISQNTLKERPRCGLKIRLAFLIGSRPGDNLASIPTRVSSIASFCRKPDRIGECMVRDNMLANILIR